MPKTFLWSMFTVDAMQSSWNSSSGFLHTLPQPDFWNCKNVDSSVYVQIIFFQSSKVQCLLSIAQASHLDLLIAEIKGFFRGIQEYKFSLWSAQQIVCIDICLLILAENILVISTRFFCLVFLFLRTIAFNLCLFWLINIIIFWKVLLIHKLQDIL